MMYIILGIVMVFWAWMQAAMSKLQKYKKEARAQWIRVDALLQTRAQYILGLLELVDHKGLEAGELLADIYDLGGGWCRSDDREVISECAEKVTPMVDRLLEMAHKDPALSEDDTFRELESNLADTEAEIEVQSERYNHSIDLYNEHRERPAIRPQIMILGAIPLRGIHIRSGKTMTPGSREA